MHDCKVHTGFYDGYYTRISFDMQWDSLKKIKLQKDFCCGVLAGSSDGKYHAGYHWDLEVFDPKKKKSN